MNTGQTVADQWHAAADNAARREILADYQIRVVLSPRGHHLGRVWLHGLDADAESNARQAVWEDYQEQLRNRDEYESWLQVHGPETEPDPEAVAEAQRAEQAYRDWLAEHPDHDGPEPDEEDDDPDRHEPDDPFADDDEMIDS